MNAIFYLLKSGCQWRLLPHDFPRWPTVYWYFRKWRIDGTWERINRAIRERLRVRLKRDPQPSAGVVDSQSVKDYRGGRGTARLRWWQEGEGQKTPHPGGHRGIRAQGQGPQREGDGLRGDQDAATAGERAVSRLRHLCLDAGYRGEDKGADWVRKALGWSVDLVERPKKPAPEEVLMRWAREWAKEGVTLDWQKFMPQQGFVVLPRRWVVERTIAWIDQQRRMSKDYERLCASSEALVYAAMIRLMTRRLARV